MAYLPIQLVDMDVYFNSTKIGSARLRLFVVHSNFATIMNTNLQGTGSLSSYIGDYRPNSDTDPWSYYEGEGAQVSNYCKGSFLFEHYFDGANVGDTIWFCNKDMPFYKIGVEYRGTTTYSGGYVCAFFIPKFFYAGSNMSGSQMALYGNDNYGRFRNMVFGCMMDVSNMFAMPYVILEANDRTSSTNKSAGVYYWLVPSRSVFNQMRYFFYSCFSGVYIPSDSENPYEGGGYSDVTDEAGEFDEETEIITEPATPVSLAVSSGFLTVYNPSYTQVVNLANYLWNSMPVDTLKKLVANPMDIIIGLSIFPFMIPNDERDWDIMIGNVHTNIVSKKALSQFVTIDCGKLFIKPYSKSYLDYSPYTKIELALPYITSKQLDTDLVMGRWLHLKYKVDLISGACMAILMVGDTEEGDFSVIAEYTGKCNIEIPLVSSDFRNMESGLIQAVAGAGAMAVTHGAYGVNMIQSGFADVVSGMKPTFERSGSLQSCVGLLGVQKPRIIKTIPRQCMPENQGSMIGFPALIKANVGELEGFTVFEDVKIVGVRMTDREKKRAKDLLLGGVYL